MDPPAAADLAPYRVVRDAQGEPLVLPAAFPGVRSTLVLDESRWGLARWHEWACEAGQEFPATDFEEEMRARQQGAGRCFHRVLSWGRRGEGLFYVDPMRDGEGLPTYLERVGSLPLATARRWVETLLDDCAKAPLLPPSIYQGSLANFEVTWTRSGRVDWIYSGWPAQGASERDSRTLLRGLVRILVDLLGGEAALPSLPGEIGARLLALRGDEGAADLSGLRALLSGMPVEEGLLPPPQMPWREWLQAQAKASGLVDVVPGEPPLPGEDPYALVQVRRGRELALHPLPGPASLPREGWLPQHHEETRRLGRGSSLLLPVAWIEDRGALTLVGEARVEGIDLASLVEGHGPLDTGAVETLAERFQAMLAELEARADSHPLCWLPPENVFLLTGTRSPSDSLRWIESEGEGVWSRVPLKWRLHQSSAALVEGIDLPAPLRVGANGESALAASSRQAALILPLRWWMRSGMPFRWEGPLESDQLSADELAQFETARALCLGIAGEGESEAAGGPETFEGPAPEEEGEGTSPTEEREMVMVGEGSAPEQAGFPGEAPVTPLLEEPGAPQHLGETPSHIHLEIPAAPVFPVVPEEPEEPEEVLPIRGRMPWLGIALLALLSAAVTGWALSGWSRTQGLYPPGERRFVLPSPWEGFGISEAELRAALADGFLAESPDPALALLVPLAQLDRPEARRRIEAHLGEGASRGDASALRLLGLLALRHGEALGRPCEDWFREAARRGDGEAAAHLAARVWEASRHAFGDAEAEALLLSAAAAGHPRAREFAVAALVAQARGDEALALAQSPSAEAWPPSLHQLGVLIGEGRGDVGSPERVAALFRRAAEHGVSAAMHDYGLCLAEGYGVPRNQPEARRWMRQAAALGHEAARRWLQERPRPLR